MSQRLCGIGFRCIRKIRSARNAYGTARPEGSRLSREFLPLSLLRVLPYCVQRVVLGQTHRVGARLAAGLAIGQVRGSR